MLVASALRRHADQLSRSPWPVRVSNGKSLPEQVAS
jgi:hypothetical protein